MCVAPRRPQTTGYGPTDRQTERQTDPSIFYESLPDRPTDGPTDRPTDPVMSRCKRAQRLIFTPFLDTFLAFSTLIYALPGFLLSHGMTINLITNLGCHRYGFIDSRL